MELDGNTQRVQGQTHSHQWPGEGVFVEHSFFLFLAELILFPIAYRSRY